MSPHVSTFENTGGLLPQMIVRVVPAGSPTGKRLELVHEGDEPLIEFWDLRYPREELEDGSTGQFILAVPLSRTETHYEGDYVLDRDEPEWSLTAQGFSNAMDAAAGPVSRIVALREFADEDPDLIRAVVLDMAERLAKVAETDPGDESFDADEETRALGWENLRTKRITAEQGAEMMGIIGIRADRARPVICLLLEKHRPSPSPEV